MDDQEKANGHAIRRPARIGEAPFGVVDTVESRKPLTR